MGDAFLRDVFQVAATVCFCAGIAGLGFTLWVWLRDLSPKQAMKPAAAAVVAFGGWWISSTIAHHYDALAGGRSNYGMYLYIALVILCFASIAIIFPSTKK